MMCLLDTLKKQQEKTAFRIKDDVSVDTKVPVDDVRHESVPLALTSGQRRPAFSPPAARPAVRLAS